MQDHFLTTWLLGGPREPIWETGISALLGVPLPASD